MKIQKRNGGNTGLPSGTAAPSVEVNKLGGGILTCDKFEGKTLLVFSAPG
jgi:hypothetical protein